MAASRHGAGGATEAHILAHKQEAEGLSSFGDKVSIATCYIAKAGLQLLALIPLPPWFCKWHIVVLTGEHATWLLAHTVG